ncbi:MAG TPA: carboxypeptidase-like regulatory domain-containing protein, partial [Chitinophagaceae bacterium]|nr:carboxypeptidase-like regulatory domain-containing protein [Chitinophagaceae bacterium]
MRRFLLLMWIGVLLSFQLLAQGRQISGTVTLANGDPVPGASIVIKGSTIGTTANEDGRYTLTVTSNKGTLVISAAGFASQEISLTTATIYDVVLQPGESLSEVVVTAFGIKKEKRSLGYTIQQVNSDELTLNHQSNVVNALQGKVAGVQISSSGGGPGQGARILIRGINSLDPGRNNQPLFIVDGVEIDNSTYTTGG